MIAIQSVALIMRQKKRKDKCNMVSSLWYKELRHFLCHRSDYLCGGEGQNFFQLMLPLKLLLVIVKYLPVKDYLRLRVCSSATMRLSPMASISFKENKGWPRRTRQYWRHAMYLAWNMSILSASHFSTSRSSKMTWSLESARRQNRTEDIKWRCWYGNKSSHLHIWIPL